MSKKNSDYFFTGVYELLSEQVSFRSNNKWCSWRFIIRMRSNLLICVVCICNMGLPGILMEDSLSFLHRIPRFQCLCITNTSSNSMQYAKTWVFVMFSGQRPVKIYPSFILLLMPSNPLVFLLLVGSYFNPSGDETKNFWKNLVNTVSAVH